MPLARSDRGAVKRLRSADLARMLLAWLAATVALAIAVELLPGLTASSFGPLLLTAAVAGVVGMMVRPLMVGVAARFGWWAVALLALAGQAVVMQVALELVRGSSRRPSGRRWLLPGSPRSSAPWCPGC